jgi:hypothetical protein
MIDASSPCRAFHNANLTNAICNTVAPCAIVLPLPQASRAGSTEILQTNNQRHTGTRATEKIRSINYPEHVYLFYAPSFAFWQSSETVVPVSCCQGITSTQQGQVPTWDPEN